MVKDSFKYILFCMIIHCLYDLHCLKFWVHQLYLPPFLCDKIFFVSYFNSLHVKHTCDLNIFLLNMVKEIYQNV